MAKRQLEFESSSSSVSTSSASFSSFSSSSSFLFSLLFFSPRLHRLSLLLCWRQSHSSEQQQLEQMRKKRTGPRFELTFVQLPKIASRTNKSTFVPFTCNLETLGKALEFCPPLETKTKYLFIPPK